MSTDNGKITRIYWLFMLVMIKAILYERTEAAMFQLMFSKSEFSKIQIQGLNWSKH